MRWDKDYPPGTSIFGVRECDKKLVWVEIGKTGTEEVKEWSFPWGYQEFCVIGKHIVIGPGIGKQIHCPICEPDWDWHNNWRTIWNEPSEYEKKGSNETFPLD